MNAIPENAATLTAAMRRNLFLLTACQAIGQAGNIIMLTVTALSVITFFPHRDLATLPTTMQHVGVMAAVFPAAALMMRMGRGFGFRVERRIAQQRISQRFQSGFYRDLCFGATFRAIGQVQIFEMGFVLSAQDGILQLRRHLALLFNRREDRFATAFEFAQVAQPLFQ